MTDASIAALAPYDDTCLRCGRTVSVRFSGPCPDCIAELHAKYEGGGRSVTAAAYEPKMNVTVNAVALKDD